MNQELRLQRKKKRRKIIELRKDTQQQSRILEDYEDAFICSNCGHVMPESDRSGNTSECGYC